MSKRNQLFVMSFLGVLILTSSFLFVDFKSFIWREWVNQLLINMSLILLTVVVVDRMWNLLGGDPQEKLIEKLDGSLDDSMKRLDRSVTLLAHSRQSGLVDLCTISGSYATHSGWMDLLRNAKGEIDLLGYSLHSWTYSANFSNEIVKLARKGVKIRIMIMDENNSDIEAIVNSHISTYSVDDLKREIASFKQICQEIEERFSVEEKNKPLLSTVTQGLITCQICRFDSKICVTPYLYSVQTSESPLFIIEGENTELFERYREEFDALWLRNFKESSGR